MNERDDTPVTPEAVERQILEWALAYAENETVPTWPVELAAEVRLRALLRRHLR